MPSSGATNSDVPLWPLLSGLVARPISEPGNMPPVPSSSAVTPNEWKEMPSLTTSKRILSPGLASMVGLWPGSPGCALNENILKSSDSTNDRSTEISVPVSSTSASSGTSSPAIMATTGGGCDIQ